MGFFTRMVSYLTLGSARPIRRLGAYYVLLFVVGFLVFRFVPTLDALLTGDRLDHLAKIPVMLQDGLTNGQIQPIAAATLASRAEFGLSTAVILLSTLALCFR